jgi:hypothetical protein
MVIVRKLKEIPADQWDKIKINNPWLGRRNKNSLIRKIKGTQELFIGDVYFTSWGLDKVKKFVDNEWPFRLHGRSGTVLPLKSLNNDNYINDNLNGLNRFNNIGKMLESGQILKDGVFVSREAFEFLAWALGDQEVDTEIIEEEFLTTNPVTGSKWDPELSDKEKETIKGSNLSSKEEVQERAKLIALLREIKKANGGGKLEDWNTAEQIKKDVKEYQSNHYDKLLTYQQAGKESKEGKAWAAINNKLNQVGSNLHQHYQDLKKQAEEKEIEKRITRFENVIKELKEKAKIEITSEDRKRTFQRNPSKDANRSSQSIEKGLEGLKDAKKTSQEIQTIEWELVRNLRFLVVEKISEKARIDKVDIRDLNPGNRDFANDKSNPNSIYYKPRSIEKLPDYAKTIVDNIENKKKETEEAKQTLNQQLQTTKKELKEEKEKTENLTQEKKQLQEQVNQDKKNKQAIFNAIDDINKYLISEKANLVDQTEKDNILKNLKQDFADKTSSDKIEETKKNLLNSIDEKQKTGVSAKVNCENEIQVEIDKVNKYILTSASLTKDEREKLQEKLASFLNNWGISNKATAAQHAAVRNKDVNKAIDDLRLTAVRYDAIQAIMDELKANKLYIGDLERKYSDYKKVIGRDKKTHSEVNEYENEMLKAITFRYQLIARLAKAIAEAKETIKTKNWQEALRIAYIFQGYRNSPDGSPEKNLYTVRNDGTEGTGALFYQLVQILKDNKEITDSSIVEALQKQEVKNPQAQKQETKTQATPLPKK